MGGYFLGRFRNPTETEMESGTLEKKALVILKKRFSL